MTKYILVQWPESQDLMEHPRFNECLFVQDIEGHEEVGSSAYMCPEDLYEEVFKMTEEDRALCDMIKSMSEEEFSKMLENIIKEDENINKH